jgi:hypothetical protein
VAQDEDERPPTAPMPCKPEAKPKAAPPRSQSDPLICSSHSSVELHDGDGDGHGHGGAGGASRDEGAQRAPCLDSRAVGAGEPQWQALGMLEGMRAGSPGPDWGPRPSTVNSPRASLPAQSLPGYSRQAHSHSMTFMRISQPGVTQEEMGSSPQRCDTAQQVQGTKVLTTSFHGQRPTPGLRYSSVETRSDSTARLSTTTTAAAAMAHSSAASARLKGGGHNGRGRDGSGSGSGSGGGGGGGGAGDGDGGVDGTAMARAPTSSGGGERGEGMVSMVGVRERARNAILMRRARLSSKVLRPSTAPHQQLVKSAIVPVPKVGQSYVYAPVFPYTAQRAPSVAGAAAARQGTGAYSTVHSVKVTTTALNGRRVHRL